MIVKKKNSQGRPKVKRRRVSVGFTLKPAVVNKLKRIARRKGVTRSALVEEVLTRYLGRLDRARGPDP